MLPVCDRWQLEHTSVAIFVAARFIAASVSVAHAGEVVIRSAVPSSTAMRKFMADP
jgi:hypothetical protein